MSNSFKYDNQQEDLGGNHKKSIKFNKQQQSQSNKMPSHPPKKEKESQVESGKGKLIEQHLKLKSQLRELAGKMDEIAEKERERKKKKLQNNHEQEDEEVVQMRKKLKQQEFKMMKIKSQITRLRKNMDSKYDLNKIVDKENQLKHLQNQLKVIDEQKESLEKIRKAQDKAIRSEDDKESKTKKSRMEEQLKQTAAQNKKTLELINDKQKQVRKLHQAFITKTERVKELQLKLNEKKKGGQFDEATPQAVSKLEDELKQIQNEKVVIQRQGNQKIRGLEREKKQLKHELERKKLILEEKEKELRLNQMKHKEIIRLINSSQQQPVSQSRVQKQNKAEGKRVVQKKGREVPKIDVEDNEAVEEKQAQQIKSGVLEREELKEGPQKHEYGFSANIEDEEIIDDS